MADSRIGEVNFLQAVSPFSDLHCLHSPETLNWIKKSNPCSLDLYPCRLENGLRSPKWLRDEILLVAEIGIRLGWPATGPKEEISRVSNLLARGVMYGGEFLPGPKFRNVNSVSRKYFDLHSARPSLSRTNDQRRKGNAGNRSVGGIRSVIGSAFGGGYPPHAGGRKIRKEESFFS